MVAGNARVIRAALGVGVAVTRAHPCGGGDPPTAPVAGIDALIVVIGPVMGFCVPWRFFSDVGAGKFSVRPGFQPGRRRAAGCTCGTDRYGPAGYRGFQEGSVRSLPPEYWPHGWDLRSTVASRYSIRGIEKLSADELGADGFVTRSMSRRPVASSTFSTSISRRSARGWRR